MANRRAILGISAYYHDSATAIVVDGKIVAGAHEERFTRKKHDDSFPSNAVKFCLEEAGLSLDELEAVVFYDKPLIKFERLLETYHAFAPRGLVSFFSSMPVWIKQKLFTRRDIKESLEEIAGKGKKLPILLFSEHHLSHAGSAFYPSPFKEAAILTVDGVGEWATATIAKGEGGDITLLREMHFPHSIGLLYSAFTYYCGFKVNSGEYKLMGLAPYGNKGSKEVARYKKLIEENLVRIKKDGSLFLNMEYFSFATGLSMCNDKKWTKLFNLPPRKSESELTQDYMDMALAIQEVTEDVVIALAKTARELTGMKNLVMAGGVALNCVANSRLLSEGVFEDIWVQPASGDAGGALGAALAFYYVNGGVRVVETPDSMQGAYLGPEFGEGDIERTIRKFEAVASHYQNFEELADNVANLLDQGKVVGWMQGKMEWGPRALGNRSILGDPRNPEMQKKLNLKIKYREGFRPFAPSVLEEDVSEYFETNKTSPYMLFTSPVKESRRKSVSKASDLYERLYTPRSDLPSITHLDYSARLQTVSKETNPKYHSLINAFKKRTGYGVIVNTSFNVRGEPIICTPVDAYRCFMDTEMDYLVIGDYLFDKLKQPAWEKKEQPASYGLD